MSCFVGPTTPNQPRADTCHAARRLHLVVSPHGSFWRVDLQTAEALRIYTKRDSEVVVASARYGEDGCLPKLPRDGWCVRAKEADQEFALPLSDHTPVLAPVLREF